MELIINAPQFICINFLRESLNKKNLIDTI